jgi:D-alanyl-D-alanine dipeptidase
MEKLFLLLFALSGAPLAAHPFDNLTTQLAARPDLIDASFWVNLSLDVRYATPGNFTHKNVYGPFHSCFLHKIAAQQLHRALEALKVKKPGWKLRVFDCLRPVRAQAQLFSVVQGTPNQKYVLNPSFGSLHSYGFAIDASLNDENGNEVDMGTPFDFFGIEAEPKHELELVNEGRLSKEQIQNRNVLRTIMGVGGFREISTEWWHFDARDGETVRKEFRPIP